MATFTITHGSRQVIITEQSGRYTSRLYVNNGETATSVVRTARTERGAIKQAVAMLAERMREAA